MGDCSWSSPWSSVSTVILEQFIVISHIALHFTYCTLMAPAEAGWARLSDTSLQAIGRPNPLMKRTICWGCSTNSRPLMRASFRVFSWLFHSRTLHRPSSLPWKLVSEAGPAGEK